MMTQNILAALDDWLGAGDNLAKPNTRSVQGAGGSAANDPIPNLPAVDVAATGTLTVHDLAEGPRAPVRKAGVRTPVRTETVVSTAQVSAEVSAETAVAKREVASGVATEKAATERQLVTKHEVTKLVTTIPPQIIQRRALADAYYQHHFGCQQCIAAGSNPNLRRCPVGLPLWLTYLQSYGS